MSQPYHLRWESVCNLSKNPNWIFKDLHRLLYKEEFWQSVQSLQDNTKYMRQKVAMAAKNHEFLTSLNDKEVKLLTKGLNKLMRLAFGSIFEIISSSNISSALKKIENWDNPAWCCSIRVSVENLKFSNKIISSMLIKKFSSNKLLNLLFWVLKKIPDNKNEIWLLNPVNYELINTLQNLVLIHVILEIDKKNSDKDGRMKYVQFRNNSILEYQGSKKDFFEIKKQLDSFALRNQIEYVAIGNIQNKIIEFTNINISFKNKKCQISVSDRQLDKFLKLEKLLNTKEQATVSSKVNREFVDICKHFQGRYNSFNKLKFLSKKQQKYLEYILSQSFLKTIACKYKLSSKNKVLAWLKDKNHNLPFVTFEHIALKDA